MISFIILLILGLIEFSIILIMKNHLIESSSIRKILVGIYVILFAVVFIIIFCNIGYWIIRLLLFIYAILYDIIAIFAEKQIAQFIALTTVMLLYYPLISLLKYKLIIEIYNERTNKISNAIKIVLSNVLLTAISKVPVKGFINVIYFVLLLYSNVKELTGAEDNVKSMIIFMSLVTYYAGERLIDSIKNINIISKKGIKSQKIVAEAQKYGIFVIKMMKLLFENYVDCGKLEMSKEMMIEMLVTNVSYSDYQKAVEEL